MIQHTLNRKYNEETRNALDQVSQFIIHSNNPAAIALFNRFEQELIKHQPNKTILKGLWDGIEKVIPSATSFSDPVTQIILYVASH